MMTTASPGVVFDIPQSVLFRAWKMVKTKSGGAGVDHETLDGFERDLQGNLARVLREMSGGTYFPKPMKLVTIPKKGGRRLIGIPTVTDRVVQMALKMALEPVLEPIFFPDSYGYRPGKSVLDAIAKVRLRCRQYDWVVKFDIQGLFDTIDHELLVRIFDKHAPAPWVKLYMQRWLIVPWEEADGSTVLRTKGIPAGSTLSPLLSNAFLHYAFDAWMKRTYPHIAWCRYGDDGLAHCTTESEARTLRAALEARFSECGLRLHPEKTSISYCQDEHRREAYKNTMFDFLGHRFHRNNGVFDARRLNGDMW